MEKPEEVQKLEDAINANWISSFEEGDAPSNDAVHVSFHEEDNSWTICDNYERFFDQIFIYRDGKWSYRLMFAETDREYEYSFEKAMHDASIVYTG